MTVNSTRPIIFLIDALGALISAVMLGIVLVYFQEYIGMPKSHLYILAVIPCVFIFIDMYYYFGKETDIRKGLKIIASCNFLYVLLSIILMIVHAKLLIQI